MQQRYKINRDDYAPAYAQLANILRQQIADGQFRPGDRLPSEAQLCATYEVSPMTVRRSINLLAAQDVVSTAQGRGTFVKPLEINAATFHMPPLSELLQGGGDVAVHLLQVSIVSASQRVARKLDVQECDRVIYLRRLLTHMDEPIFYHRTYLRFDPRRPVVEAEMDVASLQSFFRRTDNDLLKFGHLSVEVTTMDKEEAAVLQATPGAAAFHLEHVFHDFDNVPVNWGWFIWRGDRLRFTTTVGIAEAD